MQCFYAPRRNRAGFVTAVANPNPNPSTFNSAFHFRSLVSMTSALMYFRILGTPHCGHTAVERTREITSDVYDGMK